MQNSGTNPTTTGWNKDVWTGFASSNPFAMNAGQRLIAFDNTINLYDSVGAPTIYSGGYYLGGDSYYRIISFPTYLIPEISGNQINLAAHWTMSCGNDVINGTAKVNRPVVLEPSTIFLLGSLAIGLFGFKGLCKRFTK